MSSTSPTPAGPFTRPPYPTLPTPASSSSSTSSSAFQSTSSLPSLSAPSPASAPLPSPSAQQHSEPFFSSLGPQRPQQLQELYQQPQSATQPLSFDYRPNREDAGRTAAETKSLLSEYALVAEAAKRAQMAVLMRDMEGVEL